MLGLTLFFVFIIRPAAICFSFHFFLMLAMSASYLRMLRLRRCCIMGWDGMGWKGRILNHDRYIHWGFLFGSSMLIWMRLPYLVMMGTYIHTYILLSIYTCNIYDAAIDTL